MLQFEILDPYRPCFGSDPSKNYKQFIRWIIAPHAPKEPLHGPIKLTIFFYLSIAKSSSNIKRIQMINGKSLPVKRPHINSLAYIITNALKELIYQDDAQIVDLILSKRFAEIPKTIIQVVEL